MSEKINLSVSDMEKIEKENIKKPIVEMQTTYLTDINKQLLKIGGIVAGLCNEIGKEFSVSERQLLLATLYENTTNLLRIIKREVQEIPEVFHVKSIEKPLFNIRYVDSGVKFELNENLPHEIRYDKYRGQVRYDYDTQEYYSWCSNSVQAFFRENGAKEFKEKCMVLFVSYYDEMSHPIDHDNLDVKYFIDGAVKPFIAGDGPFNLSHMFIGLKGTYGHTEIYLGREEDIIKLANTYLNKKTLSV